MFKYSISRKETLLTLLKYPLRYFLEKLAKAYFDKGEPQLSLYSLDYIGRTIMIDGIYEKRELELIIQWLLTEKPESFKGICLDIGANIGNHSVFFSKKFDKVLAFEPLPMALKLLKINTEKYSNIKVYDFGLYSENKKINFCLDRQNIGGTRSIIDNHSKLEIYKLDVKKLDDLNIDKNKIKFIKMDIEGNELSVIIGAKKILSNFHPIIAFEQRSSDFNHNTTPSIEKLREFGYNKFYITKTAPGKLNKNSFFGKLITLIYSLAFGGQKILIEVDNFFPDFYPIIIAEKN